MKKNNTLRISLMFGIPMALILIGSHLVQLEVWTAAGVLKGIVSGLIGGSAGGFFFGWVMNRFANSKVVDQQTQIELREGESILFETGANHFRGAEAVGGKLYLTNQRVVFKSHSFNFHNEAFSLELHDLEQVNLHKTLGMLPNGLTITLKDNRKEKFVVQQPKEWIRMFSKTPGLTLAS